MPLTTGDLFLVNRNGTSHQYTYENMVRDIGVGGVAEQTITNGDWDLADGQFWTVAGGNINFPTVPATAVSMSGIIRTTAPITSWTDGAGNFDFPDGQIVQGEGESIIPYYVQAAGRILIGRATPSIR